ncbi:hypothetical protein [Streptomyces finlayi]|uniref:hypothetical protein n=1 Tax=Streptomyces finlayi TaxID=67296 RepID=UPI001625B132|nr:hypothetical protein [Streptomyces finlayi]
MPDSRLRTASAVFVVLAATAVAVPLAFSGTAAAAGPATVSGQNVDFNGDGGRTWRNRAPANSGPLGPSRTRDWHTAAWLR